ncbi:hypothetical protein ES703_47869 [subsurface metagenome]
MTGEGGLNCCRCCVFIPYLAYQNNIRIMAHDSPETAGKGNPSLDINLGLVDIGETVFNGVLDCQDITPLSVELINRCIKCSCFT